ncbi:hypothetical protein Ark11_1139 [Candidatus Ichthyocystis hellenicum]|uniref:Uncharacterized protein n=2 Tax=Burkholderiales genera incertae sedis TaxID=224471 RepID=A0A0S4M405_9BURK|nr:hypothetical protein Ark11_1139 [Candidatus Ichthyocystis hellenicum]
MVLVNSVPLSNEHEVTDESIGSIGQLCSEDSVISNPVIPCRSFHCVCGINISSGLTQIDPDLVDSSSVADIIHSIEYNSLSEYLSSMDRFTASFMSRSLQYVRALRFDHHPSGVPTSPNEDSYIDYGHHLRSRYVREFVVGPSDYNADLHIDGDQVLSGPTDEVYELTYGRLQYMCDYFKYYVLEGQLECLLCSISSTRYEEKCPSLLLLNAIDKEKKNELPVVSEFTAKEVVLSAQGNSDYNELVISIKEECLNLIKEKRGSLRVANIKSLKIEYLDNSTRDALIKSLMEYYLSIVDKFESMAELKFKYRDDILAEKIVLPVPREVAEVVHEEIETGIRTSNYHYSKVDHFFCDGNRCLCPSSIRSRSNNFPVIGSDMDFFIFRRVRMIRMHVMNDVVNRMKIYILSLNTV